MLINALIFGGGAIVGFIVCLCLPNKKYKKAQEELSELKSKIADAIDGDDDDKETKK
jgi:hypothetical protein